MNFEDFQKKVVDECTESGIQIKFSNHYLVNTGEGLRSSGYFCEDEKVLAVALRSARFKEVFVHEYSHFLQWRDRPKFYKKVAKPHDKFYKWLNRDLELNPEELRLLCTKGALAIEYDCEKTALRVIKECHLPLNQKEYARNANAYLYFICFLIKTRKWYSDSPYKYKSILGLMPTKLLSPKAYFSPPEGFEKLTQRYCLKP